MTPCHRLNVEPQQDPRFSFSQRRPWDTPEISILEPENVVLNVWAGVDTPSAIGESPGPVPTSRCTLRCTPSGQNPKVIVRGSVRASRRECATTRTSAGPRVSLGRGTGRDCRPPGRCRHTDSRSVGGDGGQHVELGRSARRPARRDEARGRPVRSK